MKVNFTNWLERFDSFNRERSDGSFTLEVVIDGVHVETMYFEDEGFFKMNRYNEDAILYSSTYFKFKREKENFRMFKFYVQEKFSCVEVVNGSIFHHIETLSFLFRNSFKIDEDLFKKETSNMLLKTIEQTFSL